jgi:hypothetical protein
MHSFVNPKYNNLIQVGGYKGGQTHQGPINTRSRNTNKQGGVGGHFGMRQGEVYKETMVYALDGIEAILGNTFLNINCVDVLKGGLKFKIITRLTNKFVNLEVECQANLIKVGIHLVSL